MNQLRSLCNQSPRFDALNDEEYAWYKKEIGAYELQGYEKYFLDLIDSGKKVANECNSIVAYLANVSDYKPAESMTYKGGTLPDVDTDFADDKRELVIQYMIDKYKPEYTAGIGAYNYMWARSAVDYAGKALGYPLEEVALIKSLVPLNEQGKNWHIDEALKKSPEFKAKYDNNSRAKELIDWAAIIDGTINGRTQHAAGIVVSADPISEMAPTFRNKTDKPVLEFVDDDAEALGLVKNDFLGLKTLTVISTALRLIKEKHGVELTLGEIPIDDDATYAFLSSGNLLGIFQLEGKGIANFTKSFAPANLMDVTLISAGYRPGPIQFLDDILRTKNGLEYETNEPPGQKFPLLKDVLKETYGYFIYQEQIQKVVQVLAGYSDHEADEFRKIISKKIIDKMPKEKKRFSTKAKQKGMTDKDIEDLWKQMEDFASYCFNKSHALAYSILTVKTAWLKRHYAAEFYAANILSDITKQSKVSMFINEAKGLNVKVLPPDINESNADFTVVNDTTLRFGIGGIASVGLGTGNPIVKEREENGPFSSVSEFILRTSIHSNVMSSLIKAGCFDRFASRSQLMAPFGEIIFHEQLANTIKYLKLRGAEPFAKDEEYLDLPIVADYTPLTMAEMEKEAIGLYLTHNPLIIYADEIEKLRVKSKQNLFAGFPYDLRIFKSGKGCSFMIEAEDDEQYTFLLVGKSWTKYKDTIEKLTSDFVIVINPFQTKEEGTYFANNIVSLKKAIPNLVEPIIFPIPLHPLSIDALLSIRDSQPVPKRDEQQFELYVRFIGKHFELTRFVGYTNHNFY